MHSSTSNQSGNGQSFPPATIMQPGEGQPVHTMPMPAAPPELTAEEIAARFAAMKMIADRGLTAAEMDEFRRLQELMNADGIDMEDATAPYQPFPLEVLPETVARFIRHGMEANQLPDALIALPTLAMLGAAIGNKRRAQVGSRQEPPVIWAVAVCESGEGKSPALDYALAPIIREQADANDRYEAVATTHDNDAKRYKLELAEWRKDKTQPQPTEPAQPPTRERFIVSDTTVEALAPLLKENPAGLLMYRDELAGWAKGFNAYKQRGGDEESWRSFWQASTVTLDRATDRRHIFIRNAAVSVAGAIQPEALAKLLTANGGEMVDGGTAARLLLAMPPTFPTEYREVEPDARTLADMHALVRHLLQVPWHQEHSKDVPLAIPLAEDAKPLWTTYHDAMQKRRYAEGDGRIRKAMSKIERYMLRFALIVHECNEASPGRFRKGKIQAEELKAGIIIADWFEAEAHRVYATLTLASDEHHNGHDFQRNRAKAKVLEVARHNAGIIDVRTVQRAAGRRIAGNAHEAHRLMKELAEEGKGAVEPVTRSNRRTYQLRLK